LPFERLVEVLNPARSLSHHPLFQVMLVLQNNAPVQLELAGLSASIEPVSSASAKFDLSVSVGEQRNADGSPAGLCGVIEYASDVFDRASIEALAGAMFGFFRLRVGRRGGRLGGSSFSLGRRRARPCRVWTPPLRRGWRLSAARPQLPGRALALHDEGCANYCAGHAQLSCRQPKYSSRSSEHSAQPGGYEPQPEDGCADHAAPRATCLHHLHVGIDRQAQGGGKHALWLAQPSELDARDL